MNHDPTDKETALSDLHALLENAINACGKVALVDLADTAPCSWIVDLTVLAGQVTEKRIEAKQNSNYPTPRQHNTP